MSKITVEADWPRIDAKYNPGDEQKFKSEMLRCKRLLHPGRTYFEVENEEKEDGFPDTIEVWENNRAVFVEYKVSDKNGIVTFECGQPLFYKKHHKLLIRVIVWVVPDNTYYVFTADDIVAQKKLKMQVVHGRIGGNT